MNQKTKDLLLAIVVMFFCALFLFYKYILQVPRLPWRVLCWVKPFCLHDKILRYQRFISLMQHKTRYYTRY